MSDLKRKYSRTVTVVGTILVRPRQGGLIQETEGGPEPQRLRGLSTELRLPPHCRPVIVGSWSQTPSALRSRPRAGVARLPCRGRCLICVGKSALSISSGFAAAAHSGISQQRYPFQNVRTPKRCTATQTWWNTPEAPPLVLPRARKNQWRTPSPSLCLYR